MYIEVTNYKEKMRQRVNLDLVESFTEVKGSNTTVIHFKNSAVTICESIDEVTDRIEKASLYKLSESVFNSFIASGIIQSSNYLADRSVNYAQELLNRFKKESKVNTPDKEEESLKHDI